MPDDEEPDILDWQEDEFNDARRIVDNPLAFLRLPTKFDTHDRSIMERFAHTVKSDRVRAELLRALHSKGAFRHFRDVVSRNDLFQAWQDFRAEALKDIAISWCEENYVIWK